ncbi:hypothetical protein [Dactylosporangium sp. CA-092794]
MSTTSRPAAVAAPERRPWTPPRVECLETRPEISAYSGTGDPWQRRTR